MNLKKTINSKKLEKRGIENFIFKFSSFFSKFGSIVAIFLFIISIFSIFLVGKTNTKVDYLEVKSSLNPIEHEKGKTLEEIEPDLKFSKEILKYLDGDNKEILLGWLGNLEEKEQQDFLSNLNGVIKSAEKNSDDVYNVINEYKSLKIEKLKMASFKKSENLMFKASAVAFSLIMVLIVILLSIVLLLISIESKIRNSTVLEGTTVKLNASEKEENIEDKNASDFVKV